MWVNFKTDADKQSMSRTIINKTFTSKTRELIRKSQNTTDFWQNECIYWMYVSSERCSVPDNYSWVKPTSSNWDAFFLTSILQFYSAMRVSYDYSNVCRTFLNGSSYWGDRVSLCQMDQSFNLVEPLPMGTFNWNLYSVTPKYINCLQY